MLRDLLVLFSDLMTCFTFCNPNSNGLLGNNGLVTAKNG